MNRRAFLGLSAAVIAGFALDPERALWVPGQRMYFDLGRARVRVPMLRAGDIYTIQGHYAWNPVTRRQDTRRLQQYIVTADYYEGDINLPVRMMFPENTP